MEKVVSHAEVTDEEKKQRAEGKIKYPLTLLVLASSELLAFIRTFTSGFDASQWETIIRAKEMLGSEWNNVRPAFRGRGPQKFQAVKVLETYMDLPNCNSSLFYNSSKFAIWNSWIYYCNESHFNGHESHFNGHESHFNELVPDVTKKILKEHIKLFHLHAAYWCEVHAQRTSTPPQARRSSAFKP